MTASQILSSARYSNGKRSASIVSFMEKTVPQIGPNLFTPILHTPFTLDLTLLSMQEEQPEEGTKHSWKENVIKNPKHGKEVEILTTEDANSHYDVRPNGQLVGFTEVLATFPTGTAIVGETSNKISGHTRTSLRSKNLTPCRHHTGCLRSSVGCKLSGWHRSRVRFGSYRFREVGTSQKRMQR